MRDFRTWFRTGKVREMPPLVVLQARALKAAKTSFQINGVFTILWFCWMCFNVWEMFFLSPWYVLNALFTAAVMVYHAWMSRKTLRGYVELKARYERGE